MAKEIGEWVRGDTMRPLEYTATKKGVEHDLTAAVCTLEGVAIDEHKITISRAGTVAPDQVANKGLVTFTDISNGASATKASYDFRVKVVQGGLTGYTEIGRIVFRDWP